MHIAVDLNAPFVVHAGSCVWRLLSSSVAMRRGRERERTPSLISCGCDAPRVAALSWAPCPIEGGMAGNFVAASWMDEGALARVAVVVGACSVCVLLLGVVEMYLVMRMRWLCRWMCRVLRVTAA
ncbi:surface protease GP63 [Trypanosoma cruzi]|nr:surface protease GP63 [Trypanosoma cruzi]